MERKIKILHILPSLSRGGAEKICYDILTNLNREKFIPELILFKDNGEGIKWKEELGKKNIKIINLKKNYLIDVVNFWQLVKEIKRFNPDIVHTHLGADVFGRIAACLANIKTIVATEHNINKSEKKIITWLKGITSIKVDKIFAVSQAVKVDAIKRYKTKAEKFCVIHNGIDTNYFVSEEKHRSIDNRITIGAMGRLTTQKGFSILIESVEKIKEKNIEVIIAGQGDLELELKKRIGKLNLNDKVRLVGKVDPKKFLSQIDIFIFPSLWEGLGLAALEAGAMNVPIIASETGGIKEIITNESGFLFKTGDEGDLANKINYVISHLNTSEVEKRVVNARKVISERFSLKKMIFDYSVWYEKLYYNKR
ncbi:MAG TPA: glycosyltransferase [Patescibacteria group bacterium]|nr:glycosyltransferase [Patescibacteria group bacterium]